MFVPASVIFRPAEPVIFSPPDPLIVPVWMKCEFVPVPTVRSATPEFTCTPRANVSGPSPL